jgi:flagellar protein FliO/FliZ
MTHPKIVPTLVAGLLAAVALVASPAPASAQEPSAASSEPTREPTRTSKSTLARQRQEASAALKGSQGWWMGTAGMIVVLGAAGALCIAVRRQAEGATAGRLRVLGRVSLPPKHAVFLVKAGGRTLLIGTGPQGAPSLLGELDDDQPDEASASVAAAVARNDSGTRPVRSVHAQQRFDVRLGDES